MNVEKLLPAFKDVIQKRDFSFDVCCYVYDLDTADRYTITEVVGSKVGLCIYYSEPEGSKPFTIDDIWTHLCSVDESVQVYFINRETGAYRTCKMVDYCLDDSIEFKVGW